jgi:hypothetical protein
MFSLAKGVRAGDFKERPEGPTGLAKQMKSNFASGVHPSASGKTPNIAHRRPT